MQTAIHTRSTSEVFVTADAPGDDGPTGESEIRARLGTHLAHLWRYGVMLSHRRDVADDLVQATVVRALERAWQFEAGTRLDSWLLSILRSIWLNEVRARRVRVGEGVVDADGALSFDGARHAEMHVLANQMLRFADALPETQKTAVRLVCVEGLSYREVADQTGVPIGTVMSRLAAARTKLADSAAPAFSVAL